MSEDNRDLRPREAVHYERLQEIRKAIELRVAKSLDLPTAWLCEYYELTEWIIAWHEKDRKKESKLTAEAMRKVFGKKEAKAPEASDPRVAVG